jgi:hypothetical protein
VVGEVGAPGPFVAVREFLTTTAVDRILVSTLPRRSSRWLEAGLLRRLRRTTDLPITHVEATDRGLTPSPSRPRAQRTRSRPGG